MTTGDVTVLLEELARLTDAVKRLGTLAQHPVQAQSSVEIARNSKRVTQVSVKVYGADPAEAATAAQGIYDLLVSRYGDAREE
jgi:hypothetical protein